MSKRAANDEAQSSLQAKRVKRTQTDGHATGCSDPECDGCDVGEIEISFVKKNSQGQEEPATPSARELLAMAIEEAADSGSNCEDDNKSGEKSELVKRLFGMALEQFKEKEPEDRLGYAICLVELGKAVSVEESIREGLDILRLLNKKEPSLETMLCLARAAFALATFLRTRQNQWFKDERQELDEEDEKEYAQLLKKHKVSKEEIKLYKEGLEAAGKMVEQKDNAAPSREQRSSLHDIYDYIQLLDEHINFDHANLIINTTMNMVKQFRYLEDYDLLALLAALLLQKQRVLSDDPEGKETKILCLEAKNYLVEARKLYSDKHNKEYAWGWELHALASLVLSNVLEDEDKVLESFDEALEAFKKALELNPENKHVAEMIEMLQGSPENDVDKEDEKTEM